MNDSLITSCNLCSIPFLGSTDSTRLQMASKQLNQTLTHANCEVPKVIGSNFRYLTDNSTLFKLHAPSDGVVQYQNNEIMIVVYSTSSGDVMETYNTPNIKQCSGLYSTALRYRREIGPFKQGDIIYEYDSFNFGLPSYGYNSWSAYVPFFGLNHEDSLVVSESFCERACSTKSEHITIPIYTHSLFKNIYPNSPYGFIPEVGQEINGNTLAMSSVSTKKNIYQTLKHMSIVDFTSLVNNKLYFKSSAIPCRVKNGKVIDIKIHKASKQPLLDKQLNQVLRDLSDQYLSYARTIASDLKLKYNNNHFVSGILMSNYMIGKKGFNRLDFNTQDLAYVVEVTVAKESSSTIGDKFANRYANKGVVSLVLPDELRPIAMDSNMPIDVLVGPISVFARMEICALY